MLLPFTRVMDETKNKYVPISVNKEKGSGISKDYFDLFLTSVLNRKLNGILPEKEAELMVSFCNSAFFPTGGDYEKGIRFYEDFLVYYMKYNMFEDYEELHGSTARTIELWKEHSLYEVYPQTQEQLEIFFTNAAEMIEKRSERIYRKLQMVLICQNM